MKFSFVLALVAAATVVSAESNAARLARGLSPNAPVRRGSRTAGARRSSPSTGPGGECDTGPVYCCNNYGSSDDEYYAGLIKQLNIESVPPGTTCASGCNPTTIGIGGGTDCGQQPMCCNNNTFNGLINVGCTPIIIIL